MSKGTCTKGAACTFAHGKTELRHSKEDAKELEEPMKEWTDVFVDRCFGIGATLALRMTIIAMAI